MPKARAAAYVEPLCAVTKRARALFRLNFTDRKSMQICISKLRIWSIGMNMRSR